MSDSFTVFETPIGMAAIAWNERGVSAIQLPEPDAERARGRLRRRFVRAAEAAPPPEVQQAIERITALLGGEPRDLSDVKLDLQRVAPFEQRVYALTRMVAFGQTVSYGALARQLGDVHLAREVGQALARNPFPIVVPCHRVIAAHGKLGGFSARGGLSTKQRLLEIEQANVAWQLPLDA